LEFLENVRLNEEQYQHYRKASSFAKTRHTTCLSTWYLIPLQSCNYAE